MNIEPGFSGEAGKTMRPLQDEALGHRRWWWQTLSRPARWIAAAVVLVIVIALVIGLRGDKKPATPPEQPPRVTVAVAARQPVTRVISVTGTLAARRQMPVGVPGEGGIVNRVLIEPGDWVRAGQTMATIDSSVQIQQANQLKAQIMAARADATLAQSELERAQSLVGRGFISKADVDRKLAARDAARARVAVAQAQFAETQALIGRLAIRAPSGGLVLTREVEPGQIVGAASGTLFRLAKAGEMELLANLSESDLSQLSVGMPAEVTPVGSTRSFAGHIWQLSPVIDAQSRLGTARILMNYDKALRPGGFGSVQIKSGTAIAPLLPESAVLSDARGNFVYIIGPDDQVIRRDVKVGAVGDSGLPIISGLMGNEKVVLSAGAFLSPGDRIVPIFQTARK